jgi:hypothetical protein
VRLRSLQALADMAATGQAPDVSFIVTGLQGVPSGTQQPGPAAVIPFPGPMGV